jgi:ELWxxDGT repeat protein
VFDAAISSLTNVNGIVFFGARDILYNQELWRSDGRAAGTFKVDEIFPGTSADAMISNLTVAGRRLFMTGYHLEGNELLATDVIFKDGFESGGTDVWSAASTDGGDLSVTPEAALHGTMGLAARFDPGEGNGKLRVRVMIALEEEPNLRVLTLVLRRMGGQFSLMASARLDDGTRAQTPFFTITDALHLVELDWAWSEGPDASNGRLGMWIDEIQVAELTGLDNSASLIDIVRLGAMAVKPGSNGTLHFDNFESRRERYIGYFP